MPAAFVTGGSGFIGGALLRRLVADGWRVRALARSADAARRVQDLGAEAVRGDLDDGGALRGGAHGCEYAFHAAAALGDWGAWERFEHVNVRGTENVLAACRDAEVRRFVHVGTEAALFHEGRPLVEADERTALRPSAPAPYAATKARAEIAVLGASREGVFETVSIRPRFVWGKGDRMLLTALAENVSKGRWAWIAGGRHRTSTTHVDNAVEGLVRGAERGAPGNAYFVTDGAPVVFREFVTDLLATQGITPPDRNVPEPVVRAVMELGERAWGLLPLPGEPPVSRFALWIASQECTLDATKARTQLGYAPVTTISDGLAELRAGG